MRIRRIAVCSVLVAVALGGAGCSSGGSGGSGTPGGSNLPGATGTVTVRSGGKVICVMAIKDGKGTCTMSTKGYAPGTVNLSAAYSGDSAHKSSRTSTSVHLLKPTAKATPSSP
jgi:hypothetical protein